MKLRSLFPTVVSGVVEGDGRLWTAFDAWLRAHLGYGLSERARLLGYRQYRSFEEARTFVRALGIKNQKGWNAWCKSDARPSDIPASPLTVYAEQWVSWGDWLGNSNISNLRKVFRPFEEARELARSLGLCNAREWEEWAFSGKRPPNIPAHPAATYAEQWVSWGDWLGTNNVCSRKLKFLPFEEARAYARALKLRSYAEWRAWSKSGARPSYIPGSPCGVYLTKWEGWGDWLGTGYTAPRKRVHLSFAEARDLARSIGLKSRKEWQKWCASGKKPANVPALPQQTYVKQWKGWGDWLGTGNIWTRAHVRPV